MNYSDCIPIHPPYLGNNVFLNITIEEHKKIYGENYNWVSDKNFRDEYIKALTKLKKLK